MYDKHQTTISNWARSSPHNFGRVLQFVILSIRVPLWRIPSDTITARADDQDSVGVLYGVKYKAFHWAMYGANETLAYCEHVLAYTGDTHEQACAMLAYIADLPGFDLAKAGFVLQLVYGLGGCIDTHNLKRFGIGMRSRSCRGYKELKTPAGRRKAVAAYIDITLAQGGSRALWDGWCQYVANNTPKKYRNAEAVSAIHCTALGLSWF